MKAVILVENGVQDQEFFGPLYILQYEGIETEIAVPEPWSYGGDRPVPTSYKGKYGIPIKYTTGINDLNTSAFDLVIIPGGWECPEKLRQIPEVLAFVREMDEKKKMIGAICHGPAVLISAGILNGRRATCYKGMKDDLINSRAHYVDAPVVVDGNLITSPHYNNTPEFMRKIIGALKC